MTRPLRSWPRELVLTVVFTALALGFHWTGYIYVALGAALVSFGLLLRAELSERRLGLPAVVMAGSLLLGLAVLFPMRTSRDVEAYAAYGTMVARYHASPYANVPADFPGDFWTTKVHRRWRHTGSVYGPVFARTSAGFMQIAGESPLVARLLFQGLAAVVAALIGWLVWRRTEDPVALACVVANPVVVIGVVNGGHNDTLLALAIIAALVFCERARHVAAGVALGLAALVKIVALLPAAGIAVWVWRRRSLRDALALCAAVAVVALGGVALAGGAVVLKPLRAASELVSFSSFWHAILKVAARGTFQGPHATTGRAIVRVLSEAVVVGLGAFVVLRRTRAGDDARSVVAGLTLVYLLAASYVLPWYTIWVIPIAALAWRSRESLIAFGYAAFLSMAYFPLSIHAGPVIIAMQKTFATLMAPVEILALVAVVRAASVAEPLHLQDVA